MKAIILTQIECSLLEIQGAVSFQGKRSHHYLNVLRVKLGEILKGLNGKGDVYLLEVKKVNKKEFIVELKEKFREQKKLGIDVFVGMPKKESLEETIRICVELAVSNLYLYQAKYSQYVLKDKVRFLRVLESATIQSNNSKKMQIHGPLDRRALMQEFKSYQRIYVMHPKGVKKVYPIKDRPIKDQVIGEKNDLKEKILIGIGPEGGFSNEEIEEFSKDFKKTNILQFDLPIMRTPTATSFSLGHIFARINANMKDE